MQGRLNLDVRVGITRMKCLAMKERMETIVSMALLSYFQNREDIWVMVFVA